MKLERLAFVPDLALGLVYLAAWVLPGLPGAGVAGWLVLGIELEALALLGAYLIAMALVAVLDPGSKLLHRLIGIGIIVALIALAAFQVRRHQFWWPAIGLAVLLGNRLAGLITGGWATSDARMWMLMDALLGLALHVFATGPTFYLPVHRLPPLAAAGPVRRYLRRRLVRGRDHRGGGRWPGDPFLPHAGALVGDLEHWQYDTFVARWRDRELRADAFVTFNLNPHGSIATAKMRAVSPATDFSFDFHDLLLGPKAATRER